MRTFMTKLFVTLDFFTTFAHWSKVRTCSIKKQNSIDNMDHAEMDIPSTIVNPELLTAVHNHIVTINNIEVIADADVAFLYGVETKRVNEAVRNNPDKFPPDYMFKLTDEELTDLRSKFSSTKVSTKNRTATKVFTEKGLYMLATILKSRRALDVT